MRRRAWSGLALAACALACAPAAQAQASSVARLVDISGNVLVSQDSIMVSVAMPRRLAAGARVLPTLGSSATVEYDNGCRVTVAARERLEIRSDPPCVPAGAPSGVHVQAAVHR
jgi:hypothetical protein